MPLLLSNKNRGHYRFYYPVFHLFHRVLVLDSKLPSMLKTGHARGPPVGDFFIQRTCRLRSYCRVILECAFEEIWYLGYMQTG